MSGMSITTPIQIEEFRKLGGPLIDVRSPLEYEKGHWPRAINIPLFSNNERSTIGTLYKKEGSSKAITLGLELIAPKLESLKKSLEEIHSSEDSKINMNSSKCIRIYCWRGGMRSISLAWLAKLIGLNPKVLKGGYKSYRKWAQKTFEQKLSIELIGGKTGSGKTDLLLEIKNKGYSIIDLEGLANHRGSSFGALGLPPQPSTEFYENLIAEEINKYKNNNCSKLFMEDESANIGKCRIPYLLFQQMRNAPVIEINRDINERVKRLVSIYSTAGSNALKEATVRINRRLGPQRTKEALEAISKEEWAIACKAMLDYYDKCYEYHLSKAPSKETIDISDLHPSEAAELLIAKGLIF